MSNQTEAAVVTLVDRIMARALREGASDVHIEPRRQEVRVRFRVDGILVERPSFDLGFKRSVVSRLKVMATLDIAERRRPQDGAFRVSIEEREVDIRIATFPTEYGEKVVLRLLDQNKGALTLDSLGMEEQTALRLRKLILRPHGMLLVTGPTGSGKTSTLYAMLREIDARSRNIMTLEDPIEYRFEDVIQGQTNPKAGFTFAQGLRAMLRQDPDVIMVGEMRDDETAEIATKASLTGHLVLSSLHTASAIETFVRLFDMGLERYVVASALNGLLAQRLVRCLCPDCKVVAQPNPLVDEELNLGTTHYEAVGCPACHMTGYSGRTGLFELIETHDELKDLVKSPSLNRVELGQYLDGLGHMGLRSAGLAKVRAGITSLEEVMRVT